jgi:glycosyltransferase involved in cell wall biosynthesis
MHDRTGRSEKLRVLMLTHSIYERDVRIRRYSEYLAEQGNKIDIVCLGSDAEGPYITHPNIRIYPLPITRHRYDGLLLAVYWLFIVLLMMIYTTRLSITRRYDLVHVHNLPDLLVFAAILPKLKGTPILFNVHDPSPELAQSKLDLPYEHTIVQGLILIEKIAVGFSDFVITASPEFKKILVGRGLPPNKIAVVMNAADPRFFSAAKWAYKPHARTFEVLYVGTVAKRYGLEVVIKALPRIRQAIPDIKLMVYPKIREEGAALDDLIRLIRELGVSDLVQISGPAPLEKMAEIMAQAHIGLYPAFRDCHMDIALSLKIPEMMAVGLPVVASRLTVLEQLYGDAIALVPAGDDEALAEKIIQLHDNSYALEQLSEQEIAQSKLLDWREQLRIYEQVVAKLTAGARREESVS